MTKVMFIIWKWSDLENKKYDSISVENSSDKIIKIHEFLGSNVILNIIDEENYSNTNKLVLIHHKYQAKKDVSNKLKPNSIPTFYFGDGKDFIYFNSAYKMGLLNESGDFYSQIFDPISMTEGISVVAEGQQAVKARFFNGVWQYYTIQLKQRIFELKEEFLINTLLFDNTQISTTCRALLTCQR